jgi:thioredoxin-dependent peroxiredoxin
MYQIETGVDVGSAAPDFSLKDALGDTVKLSDFRGKENVLLAFYRGESDQYSTKWLSQLKDDYLEFRGLDTDVLAISTDDTRKSLDTGGRYDLPFRMLPDPGCNVIKTYSVYDDYSRTATAAAFIIDRSGKIRYKYVSSAPPDLPSDTEIIIELRNLE